MRILEYNLKRIWVEFPLEEVQKLASLPGFALTPELHSKFKQYVNLVEETKKRQSRDRLKLRSRLDSEKIRRDLLI